MNAVKHSLPSQSAGTSKTNLNTTKWVTQLAKILAQLNLTNLVQRASYAILGIQPGNGLSLYYSPPNT